MTARPVTGGTREPGDRLREAIARWLMREYEQEYTVTEPVSAWYPQAERLLALPEVAELIAAKEAVQRVRELAEEATRRLDWHIMTLAPGGREQRYVPLAELLRALDGDQP